MQIDIVIPNYSASAVLAKCLASLCDMAGVVVVDDASADDSVEVVRRCFPQAKLIQRGTNGGFAAAANDGISATNSDLVLMLNNDVELTPGLLDSIVPLFDDDSVFAVSPRIILPKRGNLDEGAKTGFWHHGQLFTDQRQGVSHVEPILYATGCAAVYRRSMLEVLGGFDEAYSPFYWEDVDLGYRAWKRGWQTLYQPSGLVYHQHSASIARLNAGVTGRIKSRNGLLFIWRNMDDLGLLAAHRRWLPFVLARRALAGDRAFVAGWREALGRRREARVALERERETRVLSDREIFSIVGIKV